MLCKHWFGLFTGIKFGKEETPTQALQLRLQHLHRAGYRMGRFLTVPRAAGSCFTMIGFISELSKLLVIPPRVELDFVFCEWESETGWISTVFLQKGY